MSTLERAIEIAVRAHTGQLEYNGQPYILHPLKVMMDVESIEAKIVAVLHDVVEDSDMTLEDLKQAGFSKTILTAVDLLTKREGQDYMEYIKPIRANPLAVEVKLADLHHNMNQRRLGNLSEKEQERMQRYHRAEQYLLSSDEA